MAYEIALSRSAADELKAFRAYDRRRIVAAIQTQLVHQPTTETRNRKPLEISPDFDYAPPLWELRVDDFRVFYDVNESEQTVSIRAVRSKSHGQTTRDIVHEDDNS